MSLVREMGAELQTLGFGTLGTDVFIGELPSSPDNAILLVTAPSEAPDSYLETEYLTIDIWARNTSTSNAYAILENIQKNLHRRANFNLTNYYVYFSSASGAIQDFEKDELRRKLLKLSFRLIYRNKNIVS